MAKPGFPSILLSSLSPPQPLRPSGSLPGLFQASGCEAPYLRKGGRPKDAGRRRPALAFRNLGAETPSPSAPSSPRPRPRVPDLEAEIWHLGRQGS